MKVPSAVLAGQGATGVTVLQALALLPPLGVALVQRGPAAVILFVVALAIALAGETLFCRLRHRPQTVNGVTTAMIFATLAPPDLAVWQIGLVIGLGVVVGELIFGGRGFGFLNAAAVALALLVFSFPGTALPAPDVWIALATIPGAALLLATGVISWRLGLPAFLVVAALGGAASDSAALTILAVALAYPAVFLLSDPAAAATTNHGRLAHGALAGLLIHVFDGVPGAAIAPEAVVFAALLASIFAPLLDHLAILWNAWRRRLRVV